MPDPIFPPPCFERLRQFSDGSQIFGVYNAEGRPIALAIVYADGEVYLDFKLAGAGQKPRTIPQQMARLRRRARGHAEAIAWLNAIVPHVDAMSKLLDVVERPRACPHCAAGNAPQPDRNGSGALMHLVHEDLPLVRVYRQCEDEAGARARLAGGAP